MSNPHIAYQRLSTQSIASALFEKPVDVVRWMGAVQAQDYAGALWAVGLRMRNATETAIEQALAAGEIVRTHPMRGTWHFVPGEDIRWLLALMRPRLITRYTPMCRQLELDETTFAVSNEVLARALQGGKQLIRQELASALEQAGLSTKGLRLTFFLIRAEADGVIVNGARRGKQFTYALLDELVPVSKTLTRDESLAELARRYFTSHGPATVYDFAWWSGLTMQDVQAALEMAKPHLVCESIAGQIYWLSPSPPSRETISPSAYLLPPYDEYTVAYKDRDAVLDPAHTVRVQTGNGIFNPIIVVNGQVVGTWKRVITKSAVILTPGLFTSLNDAEAQALEKAANHYSAFLKLPVQAAFQVGQDGATIGGVENIHSELPI